MFPLGVLFLSSICILLKCTGQIAAVPTRCYILHKILYKRLKISLLLTIVCCTRITYKLYISIAFCYMRSALPVSGCRRLAGQDEHLSESRRLIKKGKGNVFPLQAWCGPDGG